MQLQSRVWIKHYSMALEIYNESKDLFYKPRNEFILPICVRRAIFLLLFFFMRERRRDRSNFTEVAMKFLTVNLHKT